MNATGSYCKVRKHGISKKISSNKGFVVTRILPHGGFVAVGSVVGSFLWRFVCTPICTCAWGW